MARTERRAYFESRFQTRDASEEAGGKKYIEGYFAPFGSETELWPGYFEQLAPSAFDNSLKSNDIRCLFNHDSGFVLGRQAAGTLELKTDETGLWGRVEINPEDRAAMDVYARVARGDISGCSFGFWPEREESKTDADGALHTTVLEADTHEVSICTFPAYPDTEVEARQRHMTENKDKALRQRKAAMKRKLEEIKHGTETD